MISARTMLGYFLVSILWGCSNPFIKHAQALKLHDSAQSPEEENGEKGHKTSGSGMLSGLKSFADMRVLIPFLVNQMGSLVFYMLLSSEPVSVASPVCNSLTFLVTAVTSYALFKEVVSHPYMLIVGTVLIICGTTLCMI